MMGRLLRRFADPIVRRQLVRALHARDQARGVASSLHKKLLAERAANETLRTLTDRWQGIARAAQEELAELRAQQGDTK